MTEEFLLALENAEYMNEQRRLLRNQRSRRQTTINLTDGLLPYVISNENFNEPCLSNHELSSSPEPLCVYECNYDIDYDLISTEDCIDNNETDDFEDNEEDLNDNIIVLDDILSSKVEQDFLPLHLYTNIFINEFCTNLVRTFRQANLCKTYSSDMLKLIHSALPQPNNLPTSIDSILNFIQGKYITLVKYQSCRLNPKFLCNFFNYFNLYLYIYIYI
jgi:hypothetical protein